MDSILGLIAIILIAAVFLGLPVYLLYLTFFSKKVDQQIKKENAVLDNFAKK